MIRRNITSTHIKYTSDLIERDTLTERMRRARALNASPSDIGIVQYTWRSFAMVGGISRIKEKEKTRF